MKWLSDKFNSQNIRPALTQIIQQLSHEERDHLYSGGGDSNLKNLIQLRNLLDNKTTYSKALKEGFSPRHALRYLYNSDTLNRRQCVIMAGMIAWHARPSLLKRAPT